MHIDGEGLLLFIQGSRRVRVVLFLRYVSKRGALVFATYVTFACFTSIQLNACYMSLLETMSFVLLLSNINQTKEHETFKTCFYTKNFY